MKKTYAISGMHCMSCIAKVEKSIYHLGGIRKASAELETHSLHIEADQLPSEDQIRKALSEAGDYAISSQAEPVKSIRKSGFWLTYKPLLLIAAYLLVLSMLLSLRSETPLETGMMVFMSGFFLVFSFFKMLDLKGFSQSYQMYDLLASKWPAYGLMYPFIEAFLGLGYVLNLDPVALNSITLILMLFGAAGVGRSLLQKKAIQCACLGTVFNLPMSKVTLVEDLLMAAMAAYMLFIHIL